uniref:Symplekin_C domain-containing protein n=1 Tax=Ascaris lumbricoides TaxID=6252 RepID=A0A0M3IRR9_ASCLU
MVLTVKEVEMELFFKFQKTFLSLLSSYLTENPSKSPKLLLSKLQDAACRYPTSTAILERFISQCQFGLNIIPLRRFLSEDIKGQESLDGRGGRRGSQ